MYAGEQGKRMPGGAERMGMEVSAQNCGALQSGLGWWGSVWGKPGFVFKMLR